MAETTLANLEWLGVQPDDSCNISKWWIKVYLIAACVALGIVTLTSGFTGVRGGIGTLDQYAGHSGHSELLVGSFAFFFVAFSLDFRQEARPHLARVALVGLVILGVSIAEYYGLLHIAGVLDRLLPGSVVQLIVKFISLDMLAVLLYFAAAAIGFSRLTAIDALQLSAPLHRFRSMRFAYEAAVVVYFLCVRTLGSQLRTARAAARNRYKLVRRNGVLKAIWTALSLFVQVMVSGFADLIEEAESLLTERKWLNRDFTRPVGHNLLNREDRVAFIMGSAGFAMGVWALVLRIVL